MSGGPTVGAGLLERAALLVDAGRYADARRIVARVLSEEPAEVQALCLLAMCALAEGDESEALKVANRAVAAGPDEEWPHRIASVALTRAGQHDEAVRAARQAVRLAPYYWQTHARLAVALADLAPRVPTFVSRIEHLNEARTEAQRAIEQAPDASEPHFAMGYVEQERGQSRRARSAYRRALALDPDDVSARNNLAVLDLHRHSIGPAARGFAAALRTDPQFRLGPKNLEAAGTRLLRHVYWAALLVFAVAMVTLDSAPGARIPVELVVVTGVVAYLARIWRSLPASARQFLLLRLRTPRTEIFWAGLVPGAMTALACFVAFGPTGAARSAAPVLFLFAAIAGRWLAASAADRRRERERWQRPGSRDG